MLNNQMETSYEHDSSSIEERYFFLQGEFPLTPLLYWKYVEKVIWWPFI